jgi:VWFA-related protein
LRSTLLALGVAALLAFSIQRPSDAQDAPRFRTGVDLLTVDVIVVDDDGRPVTDLVPAEFRVSINGEPRRVASAEWVSLAGTPFRPRSTASEPPEGYSTNTGTPAGRLLVLAVDQPNIRFASGRPITDALRNFIDGLLPSDRLAFVAFGRGTAPISFTGDHDAVKEAVARVSGQMQQRVQASLLGVNLTLSDAIALERGEVGLMEQLLRTCAVIETNDRPTSNVSNARYQCEQDIRREAADILQSAIDDRDRSLRALGQLLNNLASIDAPKTLVLVSEGFAMFEGDGDTASQLAQLGQLASKARTIVYGLQPGDQPFDATRRNRSNTANGDPFVRTRGFELLTNATGGVLFAGTSTGGAALDRIEAESSGYYELGVESSAADSSAALLPLRVEVERRGVTIRARSTVVPPAGAGEPPVQAAIRAAASALATPVTMSALPIRVTSFNLRATEPSGVQLWIQADIGQGYSEPRNVAVALTITDGTGRVVDTQSMTQRLSPRPGGVPSSLPFVATSALAPGDYRVKLAASVNGRVGTVEHALHASLVRVAGNAAAGNGVNSELALSDLIIGAPFSISTPALPTADVLVRFGIVHGYVEAYGARAATAAVNYQVARDDRGPALLSTDVPPQAVSDSRFVFSKPVALGALPPGRYVLRAVVSVGQAPLTTLSRAFEIAASDASRAAPVAASSTSVSPSTIVLDRKTEWFLPVEANDLVEPFDLAEALRDETLRPFADIVPAAVRTEFDAGLDHLRSGRYQQAETSLKRAIRPNQDFTAALTYLAVCYAASGHHIESANAWQTAIVGRSDMPQIYAWLGSALLRAREFARARQILEEAAMRWPDDRRTARPLAMLYATTGRGLEAMEMLQRHLETNRSDAKALYHGVQWIYQLHLKGVVFRDRPDDIALARTYAEEYARAGGPDLPLVREWINYLVKSN